MQDLSEKAIRDHCPHCDLTSHTYEYLLERSDNFSIVCDANPLTEGHILIIPKAHISCVGAYPENLYQEFLKLNEKVLQFIKKEYGAVSSFEHGIFGQTVFHSHIHYLPFSGKAIDIVPEDKFSLITNLSELKILLAKDGGYLFFSIADQLMSVDVDIAAPRFFRDRYAKALGRPERGNWKEMQVNPEMVKLVKKENLNAQNKWKEFKYE
jgi:diadenosine tetraphosphate (Ap4A) HIT family hydrolase